MAVAFDEMNGLGGSDLRPAYQELSRWLKETPPDTLEYRRQEAELLFRRIGITFAVYGDAEAQERLIPFDVIPRIMSAKEWTLLEKGLKQRVKHEILAAYLADNVKVRFMEPDGGYMHLPRRKEQKPFSSQDFLIALAEGTTVAEIPEPVMLPPRRSRGRKRNTQSLVKTL